jgi:hypothetical protein
VFQENVFRFFAVRSGNQQKKSERTRQRVPVYAADRPTELGRQLQRVAAAGGSAAEMQRVVVAFQSSAQHVKRLDGLPFDVAAGLGWVSQHGDRPVADLDLAAALQALYGAPAKKLAASDAFRTTLDRIADTIVAEAFRVSWQEPTDTLTAARKWLALIDLLAQGQAIEGGTLAAWLADLAVAIPDFAALPRPPAPAPAPPPPPPAPDPADKLRERLTTLEATHRELSRVIVDEDAIAPPKAASVAPRPIVAKSVAAKSARTVSAKVPAWPAKVARVAASPDAAASNARVLFKREAVTQLSEGTQAAMRQLKVDLLRVEPTAAVGFVEEEMRLVSSQLAALQPVNSVLMLGGVALDTRRLRDSMFGVHKDFGTLLADRCNFQAGVGDLLLVKQTLKAYELAEFAHVENVLAGESREREHRRLNVREEIIASEEERETEKERNLQSTERNEMQSEAEKTVKSQFQLEAGLQVSGSYGPAVSFSASLNAGFSTSSEETQRKAVSYSREVTEKTSERVRERVKQETRRRMLEQVEEINRHAIVNTPASSGHIRGIYRWLNKVYDAQIFNYGQRMMFEFVVPEPAAYLLYALIENPPRDNELVKPEPPTQYGAPLKPSHLTRTNYLDWVAKYQVRNVPAPPPQFQHVAVFDKQDGVQDRSTFGRSTKADVPVGYEAYAATVMSDYSFRDGDSPAFHVMLGGTSFDMTPLWGSVYRSLGNRYKELGIAYNLRNVVNFTIAIDVHCRLTAEGFGKWQQQAYDAIMEAYLVQKADYEEKLAALAIQQGVKVLGRNPLENQRITREELKKLTLMMLTRSNSIARNSMLPGAEPNIDLPKACVNGAWIRFFENAFEWNNLLYVLYPYFWGRKARWISALHFTDPDPDFAAFLKAGAARVQVPVRPGFERAVAHFCQFGEIWEGNDPPLRDDALYVPIVEEIAANLGKLDDGVPYPEGSGPWEVKIPTSLVLVQNLEEIPGIRDALTGNVIAITN